MHTCVYVGVWCTARENPLRRTCKEPPTRDLPGGPVVKNLLAKAGDLGWLPGPGRLHIPWGSKGREPQLLKPVCLEPVLCKRRSHALGSLRAVAREQPPLGTTEKASAQPRRRAQPQIKRKKWFFFFFFQKIEERTH